MTKIFATLAASAALVITPACSSLNKVAGADRTTPDEFRVVTKPPLTVPPEYNLRPPAPGETQPAEIDAANIERAVTFGQEAGVNASASERLLVAKAGANAVSPSIRAQIDYEEAGIVHKPESFADKVLFWRGSDEELAESATDSATGGEQVTIERGSGSRIKLPGT
ncbi:MAG: DUF3035 domain-containing protein [Hyphomonadaceae bacterium]